MGKILVTHNDFDGVTCAVLFKAAWPDGQVYFDDYKTVNNRLRELVLHNPDAELFITDISPENDPELINQLTIHGKVLLFDHHKTALPLAENDWATVDTSMCGAMLFFNWLNKQFPEGKELRKFGYLVWHANDYDLWNHISPLSKDINKLLTIYGRDKFIKRFLEYPCPEPFQPGEELLLVLEKEREDRYIQEVFNRSGKVHRDSSGRVFALVFAEQYTSQLGHYILDKHPVDYVVIVNFLNGTVSLRSNQGGVDVSEIAKQHGGGGHPTAAGFTLPEACRESVVELLTN